MQSQFQRSSTWLSASPSRERAGAIALNMFEGVVIAGLAWQVALFGWTVITPATILGAWQPQAQASATADRSIMGSFDPFFRSAVDDGGTVSDLGLVLAGTRVDSVSGRGDHLQAERELRVLGQLEAVKDLHDGFVPRRIPLRKRNSKSRAREVIDPPENTAVTKSHLRGIFDIHQLSVRIRISGKCLEILREILIGNEGHPIIGRQVIPAARVHVPHGKRVTSLP